MLCCPGLLFPGVGEARRRSGIARTEGGNLLPMEGRGVPLAAVFTVPGLPLVQVMFMAQVINALLLPFVLVFVMLLASDKNLMGPLVSGRLLQIIGWTGTGLLVLLSLTLAASSLFASA